MKSIMIRIQINAIRKKYSAIFSSFASLIGFSVLILMNENIELITRNIATKEVISSRRLFSVLLDIWSEVMMNKQNPKRLAEVFKMCCDVLFAIFYRISFR